MSLRPCLQEPEALHRDFTKLFDSSLYALDTMLVPEAAALYDALGVKKEPLTLIPPQFDAPLPVLTPAVYPPAFQEPPPPALELFDLDEQFASERGRLAQLANKCLDSDLEYFIKEAGLILGVTTTQKAGKTVSALGGEGEIAPALAHSPKGILEHILRAVATYKCLSQEVPLAEPPVEFIPAQGGPTQQENVGPGGGKGVGLSKGGALR